jgi:hypothetical protein
MLWKGATTNAQRVSVPPMYRQKEEGDMESRLKEVEEQASSAVYIHMQMLSLRREEVSSWICQIGLVCNLALRRSMIYLWQAGRPFKIAQRRSVPPIFLGPAYISRHQSSLLSALCCQSLDLAFRQPRRAQLSFRDRTWTSPPRSVSTPRTPSRRARLRLIECSLGLPA